MTYGATDLQCLKCSNDNPEHALFCVRCGAASSVTTASGIRKAIKVWLVGGLMGLFTGLSFILVHDALTSDLMFDLWELGVAILVPLLIAVLVALATRSKIGILLTVAFLTLVIPVCGASFGASGSEPLWMFGALGLVGGLVWSIPFSLWELKNRSNNKSTSEKD